MPLGLLLHVNITLVVFLTTTASAVVPSALMTAGALLITAVVRGVWMVLASWANSGCFFLMCWTILVWSKEYRQLQADTGAVAWKQIFCIVHICSNKQTVIQLATQGHNFMILSTILTLLLYCLAQCGQQTGAVAMVPVSWVCVLNMGSGSPGAAGRNLRMLGGSSAPGWFFSMWAFLLLALLYTCKGASQIRWTHSYCTNSSGLEF